MPATMVVRERAEDGLCCNKLLVPNEQTQTFAIYEAVNSCRGRISCKAANGVVKSLI